MLKERKAKFRARNAAILFYLCSIYLWDFREVMSSLPQFSYLNKQDSDSHIMGTVDIVGAGNSPKKATNKTHASRP
jgi:hypothetical protein